MSKHLFVVAIFYNNRIVCFVVRSKGLENDGSESLSLIDLFISYNVFVTKYSKNTICDLIEILKYSCRLDIYCFYFDKMTINYKYNITKNIKLMICCVQLYELLQRRRV